MPSTISAVISRGAGRPGISAVVMQASVERRRSAITSFARR